MKMQIKVDHGWSWVVLAAMFGTHFLSGSLLYSAGIVRVNLLQNTLTEDKYLITWITAIYVFLFSVTGLFASALIQKFGCRVSLIVGAFLQTLGFIGSYLVTDTYLLLLTLGVIAGTGCGIAYSTAMIVISYHFDRYLGLASGIAVSAQGFGTMMINLIELLVNSFGLRNFFLLVAGYALQNVIFGALLRPSQYERKQFRKAKIAKMSKTKNKNKQDVNGSEVLPLQQKIYQNGCNEQDDLQNGYKLLNKNMDHSDQEKSLLPNIAAENETNVNLDKITTNLEEKYIMNSKNKDGFYPSLTQTSEHEKLKPTDLPSNGVIVENLEHNKSAIDLDDTKENETCIGEYTRTLKNYRFILLLVFVLFFACAETLFFVLLPSYFIGKGSTQSEVSRIFSFVGIASTCTRLLTGVIVNKNLVPLTILFSAPSLILAIISFIIPHFIHLFWVQLLYSLLYGFLDFSIYSLLNKICVVIIGVEGTAVGIGLIMTMWGFAAMIGSPITEEIVVLTGSPDTIPVVLGILYLLASIVVIPVTYRS